MFTEYLPYYEINSNIQENQYLLVDAYRSENRFEKKRKPNKIVTFEEDEKFTPSPFFQGTIPRRNFIFNRSEVFDKQKFDCSPYGVLNRTVTNSFIWNHIVYGHSVSALMYSATCTSSTSSKSCSTGSNSTSTRRIGSKGISSIQGNASTVSETAGELTFASAIKLLSILLFPSKFLPELTKDDLKFKTGLFIDWGCARNILGILCGILFNRKSIGYEVIRNRYDAAVAYNDELYESLTTVYEKQRQQTSIDATMALTPEVDDSGADLATAEEDEEEEEEEEEVDSMKTQVPSSSPVSGILSQGFAQDEFDVETIITRLLENVSYKYEDVADSDWHMIDDPILVHCFDETWLEPVLLELWRKILLRNKGTRLMCTQCPNFVQSLLSRLSFKSEVRLVLTNIPARMTRGRFTFHLYQILPPEAPSTFDIRRAEWAVRHTRYVSEVNSSLSSSSIPSLSSLRLSPSSSLPIASSNSSFFSSSPSTMVSSSSKTSLCSNLVEIDTSHMEENTPKPGSFVYFLFHTSIISI